MSKGERRVIEFLRENYICIFWTVITVMGLFLRFACRSYVSTDARNFLLPWYEKIKQLGGHALSEQVGDYNILFQTVILFFTFLPIKPLYAYKLFSCVFDYALAAIVGLLAENAPQKSFGDHICSTRFVAGYTAVLFSPLVLMNSAFWAQCDSVYCFFVFAALYAFLRGRYHLMFLLYGAAFSFKLQAIFALPFVLILYLFSKRFSIVRLLYIPAVMMLTSLPGFLAGRSLLTPFSIYLRQTGEYRSPSLNYNSFWNVPGMQWPGENGDYQEFRIIAILFTVAALGLIVSLLLRRGIEYDVRTLTFLLHITVFTCVLFLPSMHERYSYLYEISAILLAVLDRRLFLPMLGVLLLGCETYGYYLFSDTYSVQLAAALNVLLYAWYVHRFFSGPRAGETPRLISNHDETVPERTERTL